MASTTAPGLTAAPAPAHAGPAPAAGPVRVPVSDAGPVRVPTSAAGPVPVPTSAAGPVRGPVSDAGPARVAAQAGGGSRAEAPTVPAHMLPHRTPAQLLSIARQGLTEAANTSPDGLRYATAHLAALRAAAALLAARARPSASSRRAKATSAWSLLVLVAPEFSDWAGYFALGASKRAAAQAGIPRVVTAREADDLLRAAEQFVTVAESSLGLSYQPPLAA
jgi:hypothetical protein